MNNKNEKLQDFKGTPGAEVAKEQRTENELRENEERIRLLALASNDCIWDWDLTTGRVWWNEQCDERFRPASPESMVNPTWWFEHVHPEDRAETVGSFLAALSGIERQWFRKYRWLFGDGQVAHVFARCHIVRDDAGQAKRVAGALLDTTEWRRAEESLRAVSRQLLHLQEEERRRIARELHDSTAQKMTSILLNLRLLQDALNENPEQAKSLTSTCVSAAEDCIQEVRTLSYLLHPPLLDELGLAAALDSYVTGFSRRSGIKVTLEADRGIGELSQDVALALFRVVQESLANVHRHSGSAVASVQLMQRRDRVILEVGDQGRGIAPETIEQLKALRYSLGVGIMGMRERLEQLGGTLELESSSGGTLVRAILPLGQK